MSDARKEAERLGALLDLSEYGIEEIAAAIERAVQEEREEVDQAGFKRGFNAGREEGAREEREKLQKERLGMKERP